MGWFNGKKKSSQDRMNEMIDEIKEIMAEDKNLTVIFCAGDKNGGSSLVQGDAFEIHKLLEGTANNDKGFATILKAVAKNIKGHSLEEMAKMAGRKMPDDIPPAIKDIFDQMKGKNSQVVDLPGGGKGLAIDASNIKNMSDKDIDDIIDNMINNQPNDDEEDTEG